MGGFTKTLEDVLRGLVFAAIAVTPAFSSSLPVSQDPKQTQDPKQKDTAPDERTQQYQENQIRRVFTEDYRKGDIASKLALSDKLVQSAQDPKNDSKLKFTFYREAARVAAEARDLPKAFSIVDDKIVENYNVRDLGLKYEMFNVARRFASTAEESAQIAGPALELCEAIYRVEDFAAATKLASDIKQLTKLPKELVQQCNDLTADIKKVQNAELALTADPKDAKAANIYARFKGMRRHKWEEAKELMKTGNDEDLKTLINMEVMNPQSPNMQFGIGQKYADVSKTLKSPDKELYERRAAHWYESALPNADALLKAEIENKMKELKTSSVKAGNLVDLLKLIDLKKDVVSGKWRIQDGNLVSDPSPVGRIEIPYQPPEEYDFQITFTPQAGNIGGINQILAKTSKNQFAWGIGGWGNKAYGFDLIDGKSGLEHSSTVKKVPCLEAGKTYTSLVQVRKDRVVGYVDGRKLVELKTNYDNLKIYENCKLRDNSVLGILSHETQVLFQRIEIVEITGKGQRKR